MSALADVVAAARRDLELKWASEEQRDLELTAAEQYARDPLAFLNSGFVWIGSKFDRHGNETRRLRPLRLKLFPGQVETIEAWIDLDHLAKTGELHFRNTLLEKSRQIGETWAVAGILGWAVHFHPGVHGLAMHRKGAKIDDGGVRNTIDSLFGKIRYIDARLGSPNGLPDPDARAAVPGLGELAFRPFSREPAKVENHRNGAFVVGEGQTDDPGRGDTFDFVVIDEAAFVEHGESVHAAVDEACPDGKLYLSTVKGEGNVHARLCKERPAGYRYLRLHWSDHPVYREGLHVAGDDEGCVLCAGNRAGLPWTATDPRAHRYPGKLTSPWYDVRVIGKTDEQVANELDIDRERSLSGRVFPEFSTQVHVISEGIEFDPELPVELAWDYGLDVTSVIVLQDAPLELRAIGILEMGDLFETSATPDNVARELREYLVHLGVPRRLVAPEWTRRMTAIGDPSGHSRTLETGKPFVNAYRKQGFQIQRPSSRLTRTVDPSINAVKRLLLGSPKALRICGINAGDLATHLRNNKRVTDSEGNLRVRTTEGPVPIEDNVHNHACRALAYYAVKKFPPPVEADSLPTGPIDPPPPGEEPPSPHVYRDLTAEPDPDGPLARRRHRQSGPDSGIRPGMTL